MASAFDPIPAHLAFLRAVADLVGDDRSGAASTSAISDRLPEHETAGIDRSSAGAPYHGLSGLIWPLKDAGLIETHVGMAPAMPHDGPAATVEDDYGVSLTDDGWQVLAELPEHP